MRLLLPILCAAALCAGESDYQQSDQDAFTGVNMTPPSGPTQAANGLDPHVGVEVQSVYPGTTADHVNMQKGDVITSINGSPITSMTDLRNEVSLIGVGGTATFEIMRNGQKIVKTDTLGVWPKNVPREPIDEAAERRFRDWQSRRLDRTQQAVASLRKQVEDLERMQNLRGALAAGGRGGPLTPAEALRMPMDEALAALPAFHLTLNVGHDSVDTVAIASDRTVAWDARVLIGSPEPTIH